MKPLNKDIYYDRQWPVAKYQWIESIINILQAQTNQLREDEYVQKTME